MNKNLILITYLFHTTCEFVYHDDPRAIKIKIEDFNHDFFRKINKIETGEDVINFNIYGKRVVVHRDEVNIGKYDLLVDTLNNGSYYKENIDDDELFLDLKIALLHDTDLEDFGFCIDYIG